MCRRFINPRSFSDKVTEAADTLGLKGNSMSVPNFSSPLRPPGPAQADWLVHFCARPWGTAPSQLASVADLSPQERLDGILWEQRLLAGTPYGSPRPMVCLSEAPWNHVSWMVGARGFPPWAVLISRQWAYASGGGPVWYAREAPDGLSDEQRSWVVRLDTDPARPSDWLHEREWRIPVPVGNPQLFLGAGALGGILVGDPRWQPTTRFWPGQVTAAVHPSWGRIPRFCLDPSTGTVTQI
jgi:hypothetical protein